ncbi:DegT/DnrJ/EryC1/StrS aminotransferase family protein [Candidatus Woesearchaeota archaeon]|nr:MAG: DegT/DnrJ/EryC1/StrS aminotransferase family protein [Candidatus Woesearchaeota archaeon]
MKEDDSKLDDVLKKLKKITKHKHVKLTERGNSAIFLAMAIAKKTNPRTHFLIPDQGGWYSYKKYPQYFNFTIKEIKTDYGIIDLDHLQDNIENSSAFIFSSFAGYFAEQPLKKIAKICKKNNCLVIEDASGAVGDSKLCKGKYSDIIVASFGKWKPINYGYGGFISVAKEEYFEKIKNDLSLIKVHPAFYRDILPMLNNKRLKAILNKAEKVKKELKSFDIFHKDKRGLNVVAKFDPGIVEYCQKNNYPYFLCPNYIRVNEKAISIELKRLDNDKL